MQDVTLGISCKFVLGNWSLLLVRYCKYYLYQAYGNHVVNGVQWSLAREQNFIACEVSSIFRMVQKTRHIPDF